VGACDETYCDAACACDATCAAGACSTNPTCPHDLMSPGPCSLLPGSPGCTSKGNAECNTCP
jgi:hypothetical protein